MKKAIEKYINNGGELKAYLSFNRALICIDEIGITLNEELSYYYLIFGTDFIDKLVDGDLYCSKYRDIDPCSIINCPEKRKFPCNWSASKSDYHRAQLSNLKDITKIKEYINNLVEGR